MGEAVRRTFRLSVVRAGASVLLCWAAYASSIHGPFVFDDFGSLTNNPSIDRISWAMFSPPREQTLSARPISNASFAINRALTGSGVEGLHAGNLLIHLLAVLCLLGLVRRTLRLPIFGGRYDDRADVLATLVAILWAIHPIQTESVTYLVQRVESLTGLFILFTLYASLRGWSVVAIVSSLLAMGSKENGVVAPLLVVLFDRAFLFDSFRAALRKRWSLYVALAATCGLVVTLAMGNARHFTAGLHFQNFGPFGYLRIQVGAIVHYLRLMVWPHPLVFDYGEPNGGVPLATRFIEWGPPTLFLTILAVASLLAWRKHPALGFLGVAFFVLLAPSSSVIPVRTEAIAEHRMYLASAAVIIAIVFAADALLKRGRLIVAAAAIAALLVTTIARNAVYRSSRTLWEDTVEHWPGNARAIVALADELRAEGDYVGFRQRVAEALVVSPTHVLANERAGELAQAAGRCDEAIQHFRIGLERLPDDPWLRGHMAECLARTGQLDEAIGDYRSALEHDPNNSTYYFNLGGLYVRTGHDAEAYDSFEQAARLDPGSEAAHDRAGIVAGWLGRTTDAERELEVAAGLSPRSAGPLDDLAWLLATRPDATPKDVPRALDLAQRAKTMASGSRRAWDVLAAAEAADGHWDDAIRDATTALQQPIRGYADASDDAINQRLTGYRSHIPWRAPLKGR